MLETKAKELSLLQELKFSFTQSFGKEIRRELGVVLGIKENDLIHDMGFIYDDCYYVDIFLGAENYKKQRIMFPKKMLQSVVGIDLQHAITRQDL